jgi:hypothetical protein
MRKLGYVRLFRDLDQALHAPPAPPLDMASLGAASGVALIGGDSDWGGDVPHPAPVRQFLVVLVGRAEITASDGSSRQFDPGDLVLIEDTSGKGHSTPDPHGSGRSTGDTAPRIVSDRVRLSRQPARQAQAHSAPARAHRRVPRPDRTDSRLRTAVATQTLAFQAL